MHIYHRWRNVYKRLLYDQRGEWKVLWWWFAGCPNASVTDGLLDVMLVEKVNRATRLRYLPVIQKGKHLHLPFVKYAQVKNVHIETDIPPHAHRDGEYFNDATFKIDVLEKRFAFLL